MLFEDYYAESPHGRTSARWASHWEGDAIVRIGILSDNHGRLEPVSAAVEIFRREGVDRVVHCGDVGGVETLELLADWPCWFVWGNMDQVEPTWRPWVESIGAHWPAGIPVVFEADDKRIAICHGHERPFQRICDSGEYAYVLHGHTHRQADVRQSKTRIINPGALYRAATKTVAVLDPASDDLRIFNLPPETRA